MPPHATGTGGIAMAMPPPAGTSGTPATGSKASSSHRIVCANRNMEASDPSRNATTCSPVAGSKLTTCPAATSTSSRRRAWRLWRHETCAQSPRAKSRACSRRTASPKRAAPRPAAEGLARARVAGAVAAEPERRAPVRRLRTRAPRAFQERRKGDRRERGAGGAGGADGLRLRRRLRRRLRADSRAREARAPPRPPGSAFQTPSLLGTSTMMASSPATEPGANAPRSSPTYTGTSAARITHAAATSAATSSSGISGVSASRPAWASSCVSWASLGASASAASGSPSALRFKSSSLFKSSSSAGASEGGAASRPAPPTTVCGVGAAISALARAPGVSTSPPPSPRAAGRRRGRALLIHTPVPGLSLACLVRPGRAARFHAMTSRKSILRHAASESAGLRSAQ